MKRKVIDLGSSSDSSDSSPPKGYKNISPTNSIGIPAAANNRQLASRRGHLKSRLGCFNCKRRRVKCNELRPACSSCSRLGLSCVYPTSPTASGSIRANPSVLSLEDLRFYHRFLTTAFPTLPLGDDKVWAQCTAMSHQSECLAHAVLGLGASHLSEHGNTDYTAQALSHRVTAIKLVNEQFVNPPKNQDMKDAMFAAVFCLAAQTTLLPDGMIEYLTITRAGTLIWAHIMPGQGDDSSIFKAFTTDNHTRALEGIVSEEPKDFGIVDGFLASVTKLRSLCEKPYEVQYLEQAVRCVDDLQISSVQAWKAHADLWRLHCFFSNEDFVAFANPDNFVAQLLIMHMLLLDYVLGPFCVPDTKQFRFPARKRVIISWGRQLVDRLPDSMKQYGDWIKDYCNTLEHSTGNYLLSP